MWSTYQTVRYYLPPSLCSSASPSSLCSSESLTPPTTLALFDLDGTLITSPSGRPFGLDWIFFPAVLSTLSRLVREGQQIVIISNQSRFNDGIQVKLDQIVSALSSALSASPCPSSSVSPPPSVSPLVLIATAKDDFRKPETGMISLLATWFPFVPMYMVGDAVGSHDPFPPYRWADSDRMLAEKAGIPFYRAQDVFLPVDPVSTLSGARQLVILMGNPGSGKSTLASRLARAGWTVAEKDVLSPAQMKQAVRSATGSVVIDGTHGSRKSRQEWVVLGRQLGFQVTIWWLIRDGRPFNALREKPVPALVYNVYSKHFEDPRLESEVVIVD